MTIGVATERGTVRAVALADHGEKLAERVVMERTEKVTGDTKADLAAAVELVLEEMAAKLGPDREVVGAAVAYRDAAERRAIVTKLAAGPWHEASLVSSKAAHLAVSRAMTWVDEFEDLAVCEVVPGFQAFSLIDSDRSRVLAAVSLAGAAETEESMRAAVTAAWDQFDAAGVKPDAVVLIGSAARESAVVAALEAGFGAPVIPCRVATAAPAIGAALAALPETEFAGEAAERIRRARGTAALFAAASVLAGGLVAGGVYATSSNTKTVQEPRLIDSRISADGHTNPEQKIGEPAAPGLPGTGSAGEVVEGLPEGFPVPEAVVPEGVPTPTDAGLQLPEEQLAPEVAPEPDVVTVDPATLNNWGGNSEAQPADWRPTKPLIKSQPESDSESSTSPAGIIPAPTHPAGAPTEGGLFPGEMAPPPLGTPEFAKWWDNHWHMMLQWAAQMLPKV
ncbi:hypothetical protein [Nocardia huaxiensis]|uniref:DUF7159 domain-containing protein n=1 Tax=Nocardia huaxiensis TaxID=2755382 RepID=A0A7D6Z3V8_9NOCA|nr:hypothetical protein [Nocardia huaxiensis]QLY30444.1 hypothetical protein H0264_35895 [Nocardia huaxiensis]UFS95957.1 hypothetical protein LPY97_35785 [Nocardia huaxiensis]